MFGGNNLANWLFGQLGAAPATGPRQLVTLAAQQNVVGPTVGTALGVAVPVAADEYVNGATVSFRESGKYGAPAGTVGATSLQLMHGATVLGTLSLPSHTGPEQGWSADVTVTVSGVVGNNAVLGVTFEAVAEAPLAEIKLHTQLVPVTFDAINGEDITLSVIMTLADVLTLNSESAQYWPAA